MKIIYSAGCTIVVLAGTFALVVDDYDFAILCFAIALAPLVLQVIFRNMKRSLAGNTSKPKKRKKNIYQSAKKQNRKPNTYKSSARKNRSRSNSRDDDYNNDFFDITDAWNSI